MDVVDSHTHVFPSAADTAAFCASLGGARPSFAGDVAEALATMDELGVRKSVLLPAVHGQHEVDRLVAGADGEAPLADEEARERVRQAWSAYNAWAVQTTREHPDRFETMVGVDPVLLGREWAESEIVTNVAAGARGVKIVPRLIGVPPDDERMAVVWEVADRLRLPVVAQSGLAPSTDVAHPDNYEAVVRDYPGVKLIMAHAGLGAEERTIALAAKYPNVHVDTSAWFDVRPEPESWLNVKQGTAGWTPADAAEFFRAVGVDRVLFGTNYAIRLPKATHDAFRALPLTEAEQQQIFAENYRRVFDD
jgi:predicted TIM-barrel fold metal-dependent hydrolase